MNVDKKAFSPARAQKFSKYDKMSRFRFELNNAARKQSLDPLEKGGKHFVSFGALARTSRHS